MGQAVTGDDGGTEAVWWNPAGLARAEKREVAIHHSQDIIATGDALSLLIPSSLLGVFVASVDILNYGDQEITESGTGRTIGRVIPRSLVYAASYATPVGSRFNWGITFKVVQIRVDCTGECTLVETIAATTSALDAGVQYDFTGVAPLTLGAAVRNAGLPLQVKDRAQADPLPTRVQLGVAYRLPTIEGERGDTEIQLGADLLNPLRYAAPSARLGGEVTWQKRVNLRGGYVFDSSERSGPSIGIGLLAGSFVVDLARVFEGFSADAGQAPIYLSLRYLF
jgi:hypothetical protein